MTFLLVEFLYKDVFHDFLDFTFEVLLTFERDLVEIVMRKVVFGSTIGNHRTALLCFIYCHFDYGVKGDFFISLSCLCCENLDLLLLNVLLKSMLL
jgi:hypothetical protein